MNPLPELRRITLLLVLLQAVFVSPLTGQIMNRTLQAEAEFSSTISAEPYQSFWLVNNRGGMFDDASANGLMRLSAHLNPELSGDGDWGMGASFITRSSTHAAAWFQELYFQTQLWGLQLKGGRFLETDGHLNPLLSSGSMGISPNATPMPRVLLSVPDFREIPFTHGWLEYKLHYGHGWMPDGRYTSGLKLHEKSFYLQTGGESGLKFFTGLNHYAQWGGVNRFEGSMPEGWRDYFRVVLALEGSWSAPSGEQMNALGNHLGFWDWGLTATIAERDLYLYYQHFYETNSGLRYRNLRDGLYGIELNGITSSGILKNLVYEFLYTRHQTGHGVTDPSPGDSPGFCEENPNCGYRYNGRDDYYNNYMYRTGWTYHSFVIGNPLFLTERQLNRVYPDEETWNSFRSIVSNRLVSHHTGFSGEIGSQVSYRALVTYVRHYGTHRGLNFGEPWGSKNPSYDLEDYLFNPPLHQWYSLLEFAYTPPSIPDLTVLLGLSLDRGDLFENHGMRIGGSWKIQ